MDTSNNRLVTEEFLLGKTPKEREQYTMVPPELEPEAQRLLAGRQEATVPKSSKSPVARWAAAQRRDKRKMQKESRRRNRA